jgi:uncharacterized protein YdbL (DUF1318 family)
VSQSSLLQGLPKGSRRELAILGAMLVVLAGCITVNVYFPESEVKALSDRIEEAVREQAGATTEADDPVSDENGSVPPSHLTWLPVQAPSGLAAAIIALPQQVPPAPEISNPAIRKIIESRAARFAQVQKLKSEGAVGENADGFLDARNLDSLALSERAQAQRTINEENADRRQMYSAIADAKGLEVSQLPLVRATYAATLREYAKAGEWIQMPDGQWRTKP